MICFQDTETNIFSPPGGSLLIKQQIIISSLELRRHQIIPRDVLLEGLENQKEFVLGQFYRCSAPPNGLVQSVVNRIWGTRCRIYTRQLGDSSFLFHIPDEVTRKWVTQRGIWHVDDCILFVSAWNPAGTLALPEITTIPVWLTLKNIPHQLYSKKGISWIASGIGAPMLTSKPCMVGSYPYGRGKDTC